MSTMVPIYYQIMQTMKSWILNKEFGPGERLPSENELAAKFNVSRLTVRQAISQLAQQGFLNSRRGEGTFVTNNDKLIDSHSLEICGPMDDLFFWQMLKLKVGSAEIAPVAPSKLVKEKLQLGDTTNEVIQIKRVLLSRDKLSNYIINYLPVEIGSRINGKDLYERTLLSILQQDFKVQFSEAIQTVEASFADQEVSEKLGIASGSPILFVERTMYGQNREPIELYQSSYRGDMYKFIFRFRNVEKKDGKRWIHEDTLRKDPS
jgi:GntR family transcriptional regulator